jgi:hypothetical protein
MHSLQSHDGSNGAVDQDLPHEVEVPDEYRAVGGSGEGDRSQEPLLRGLTVAVEAVEGPLMSVAHRREDHPGLVLQVDVGPVALLQYTLVEVVAVVDVEVPAAHLRYGHVVATELRRLHVPYHVLAVAVLVADLHHSRRHTVHSLPVHVQAIPGISELQFKSRCERYNFALRLSGLLKRGGGGGISGG